MLRMDGGEYILLLCGMGCVTFLPRWLPLFSLSNRKLPDWFVDWLDLIPAAILSALLAPILVTAGTPREINLLRPELFVAVPTFLFAFKTKSLGGSVFVGMLLYWITGKLF